MNASVSSLVVPSSLNGATKPVMPSSPHLGGQSGSVLARPPVFVRSQSQTSSEGVRSPMDSLRMEMRAAAVEGEDFLGEVVGEKILRIFPLLRSAGELLAQKIAKAPGISSHMIDVVLEIGSGKHPGLGISLVYALSETQGISLKSNIKVVSHTWDDKEVSSIFKDVRVMKILIVTAARTPEISKKVEGFVSLLQRGMNNSSDVIIKICSLVCLNDQASTTEKHIDGVTIMD